MGFWSSVKSFAKKALHLVKAIVRAVVRVVAVVLTAPFKVWDLVFGWVGWPPKKLRLHIAVLQGPNGKVLPNLDDLWPSIDTLKKVMKDRCNVTVKPYSSGNKNEIDNWAQVVSDVAPPAALTVHCDWGAVEDEAGDAGEYFAQHVAGWVGSFIPISLSFPVTVFVVQDVVGKNGCALPVFTDYATVKTGVFTSKDSSTMAHEVGHLCNLPHFDRKNNLMFHDSSRTTPYWLMWWQRNLVRSSRHVGYFF
jgi:hypothetical protein